MTKPHKGAISGPTQQRLKECLHYDPKTGIFTRLKNYRDVGVGKEAGWTAPYGKDGLRVKIGLDGRGYMAHRLAWLYMTGEWPEFEIDHRDGNSTNNRWKNLRKATSSQNMINRPLQSNNKTGVKGVCFDNNRKKFLATLKLHGKQKHIGHFDTLEEAKAARERAAKLVHGEFYRRC